MNPQNISNLPFPDLDPIYVAGGSFMMGADKATDPDAHGDEGPEHKVTIPAFYMAKYPVTQRLWAVVMGGEAVGAEPSRFQGGLRPKTNVSWEEARAFAQKLNDNPDIIQLIPKGFRFRLPTEAEWEYAAKGGNAFTEKGLVTSKSFKYAGSNKLKEVGWYNDNSHNETKPVGLKFPNELGLFDMSGNVSEWCEDDWHNGYENAPDDGTARVGSPGRGANRVYRGGDYFDDALGCRPSCRINRLPWFRAYSLGFRLSLSLQ